MSNNGCWQELPLGNAVQEVLTGPFGSMLHVEDYGVGGVPIVNPINISNAGIVADPNKTILSVKARELERYLLELDDVVVARRGDMGRCARVTDEQTGWLCGTGCFVVRPGQKMDGSFLAYLLASDASKEALENLASGVTMLNLGNKALQSLMVPTPPLDEQRRIAEVLRSVDEAIAATQATLSFCEDFLIAQRRETFLNLIEEPGETSIAFKDMCDLGRGFAFKSEDYQDTGVLNFRVTNVGKPVDDLGGQCFLPEAFMDTFDEYVLWGDEIVLVMVGATVGKLGRVPEAICPALLNQNMWTLNAKAPFTHDLLWHLAHVLIEAKVYGAQGGAYSFLTKKDFLQHRIGSFDHDKMAERVGYLSAIEAYIQRLAVELRVAIAMKAALSADLLAGHVRVPV